MIKKFFLLFVFLMGLSVCAKSQDAFNYLGNDIKEALEYPDHYGLADKFPSVPRVLDLLYNDRTIEEAKVRTISQINGTFHRFGWREEHFELDNKISSMVISAGKMKWTNSFVECFGALKQGNILTYSSKFSTPNLANYGVSQHKEELLRFDNYCVVLLRIENGHKDVWFTEEGLAKFISDFEKLKEQLVKEEEIWKAEEETKEREEEARRLEKRWKLLMYFSVSKDIHEAVYGDNRCLYDGTEGFNHLKFDIYWNDSTKVIDREGEKFIVKFSEDKNYILIVDTNTGDRYLSPFTKWVLNDFGPGLDPYRISSDVERYDDVLEVVEVRKKKADDCCKRVERKFSYTTYKDGRCGVGGVYSDAKISSIKVEESKIMAETKKKVQVPEIDIRWKINEETGRFIVYLSQNEESGFIVYSNSSVKLYVLFDKDFVFQVKDEDGKMIMNALDNYLKK